MAWFKKSSSKELRNAEALLQDADARLAAIDTAVRDQLLPLVQQRLAAEQALAEVESAGDEAAVTAAAEHLEAARKALVDAGRRVDRQRAKLMHLSDAVVEHYDQLRAVLPQHEEALVDAFRKEWVDGIEAFNRLLGRRQMLESLLGYTVDVPDPQPVAAEIEPAASAPYSALTELRRWVERFGTWAKTISKPPLEPADAVYVLSSAEAGIEAGTPVTMHCLPVGRLRHLVDTGDAHPYVAPELTQSIIRTRKAARRIAEVEADDAANRYKREDRAKYEKWLRETPEGQAEARRQQFAREELERRKAELRRIGIDPDAPGISEEERERLRKLSKQGALIADVVPSSHRIPTMQEFAQTISERTAPNRD